MNKISVIMPTYNRATYIRDAIESVLNQSYNDVELIVIDDGSTDNTQKVIDPYLADGRVKYIMQKNAGVAAARNHGLKLASGEYIAFIDSDDIWKKDKLKVQYSIMQALPDVSIVCSDFSARKGNEDIDNSHLHTYFSVLDDYSLRYEDVFSNKIIGGISGLKDDETVYWGNIYETMLFGNIILTSTTMFRKEIFKQVDMFDIRYTTCEDYDLYLKMTKRYGVALVDSPLVIYRYSNNQLSGDDHFDKLCNNLIEIFHKNINAIKDTDLYNKDKRRLMRRLGMYESQKAYYHFMKENMALSARYYWKSIRNYPSNFRSYIYLLFTLLPVHVTRLVRKIKSM